MIDRIEELLGLLAAEDEEEQEDVLVLPVTEEIIPASPHGDERGTGDGGMGDRSGGRTAGEIMAERPGPVAGEIEAEKRQAAGEPWKDAPVWTARSGSPELDGARRAAPAERTERAEKSPRTARTGNPVWTELDQAAHGGRMDTAAESAGRSGPARAGLEELYRRTVQGLRPAAPTLPPEQVGRTARAREPESAASLTVDELDRAVRRDSRRYDGGMSIF